MSEVVLLQGESTALKIYRPATYKADAILIHGFTGSKEDFDFISPLLADRGYRVITFDNRGSHESSHSSNDYILHSLASDVMEISRHFQLTRPHLLGHSLGGVIAQKVAEENPDHFASLTLMCSGPKARPAPTSALNILKVLDGRSMSEIWEEEVAAGYATHPRLELMKKRWLKHDPKALRAMAEVLIDFTSNIEAIAASGISSHVLYGENDDAWPLSMQDEMAKNLSAHLTVIADAGHCPNEDQPELTAQAIADFWDAIN